MDSKNYEFRIKMTTNTQQLDTARKKLIEFNESGKTTNDQIKLQTASFKILNKQHERTLHLLKRREAKEKAAIKLHNKKIRNVRREIKEARRLDMRYLSIMFTAQMISRAILGFSRNALDTFMKVTDSTNGFNKQLTKAAGVWEYFKFSFANAVLAPVLIPLIDIFQALVESVDAYGQEHPKMMELIGGLILLAGASASIIAVFIPLKMVADALASLKLSASLTKVLGLLLGTAGKGSGSATVGILTKISNLLGGGAGTGLIGLFVILTTGISALEAAWTLINPLMETGKELFDNMFDFLGDSGILKALGFLILGLQTVGGVIGIALVTMIRHLMNALSGIFVLMSIGIQKFKQGIAFIKGEEFDTTKLEALKDKAIGIAANYSLIESEGDQALVNYNDKLRADYNDRANKEVTINQNNTYSNADPAMNSTHTLEAAQAAADAQ